MGNKEKSIDLKKTTVVKPSMKEEFFNIVEPTKDLFYDGKTRIDMSNLNDFATEEEVIASMSSLYPESFVLGDKNIDFKTMMKADGFLSYLIFHSINQFYAYLFGRGEPFNGSVEASHYGGSIGGVEYNFITIEEEFIDRLEYLIPIVLKNFKLFETVDIFRKNANVIKGFDRKKMNEIAFFLGEDGSFENIHSFVMKSKEDILNLPKDVFGSEVIERVASRVNHMSKNYEEIMQIRKLCDELGDRNVTSLEPEKNKHQIIKKESVEKLIALAKSSESESVDQERHSIIQKYKCLTEGANIEFAKKEMLEELESLKKKFPNFAEVVDYIKGSVSLSLLKEETALYFEPIVLLGSPGLGKTAFSKALGKALKIRSEVWAVSQFNQGFTLSGLDLGWASGKPGKIFNCMTKNNIANPIVLLDELDKTPSGIGNGAASVDSILLQLFEKETSSEFVDEAMDTPVDASLINWICTANDISEINQPLLSRLKIFNIRKPTSREMPAIIDSIYTKLLNETRVGECFDTILPKAFFRELVEYEPRKVYKILKDAMRYSAQHVISAGGFGEKVTIDDLAFKEALKHEPNQKQKNIRSV